MVTPTVCLLLVLSAPVELRLLDLDAGHRSTRCLDAAGRDCPGDLVDARWDDLGFARRVVVRTDGGVEAGEAFVRAHPAVFGLDGGVAFETLASGARQARQQGAVLSIVAAAHAVEISGHLWPFAWAQATTREAVQRSWTRPLRCREGGAGPCANAGGGVCDGRCPPERWETVTWTPQVSEPKVVRLDCVGPAGAPRPAKTRVAPVVCVSYPGGSLALDGGVPGAAWVDLSTGRVALTAPCLELGGRIACPGVSEDELRERVSAELHAK